MTQSALAPRRPVALVTGAYGGMGLACARAIGRRHDLILADLDEDRLKRCADGLHDEGYRCVATVAGDLTAAPVLAAIEATAVECGGLDSVVHAAAVSPSLADVATLLRVNIVGTERLLRIVERHMIAGGAAVLLASTAGHQLPGVAPDVQVLLDNCLDDRFVETLAQRLPARDGMSEYDRRGIAYSVSKWWVLRACQARVAPWGERKVRITTISPGLIWTPMGRREAEIEQVAALVTAAPAARWGTSLEIADVAEFLLSDKAAFITGSDVLVDGGIIGKLRAAAA